MQSKNVVLATGSRPKAIPGIAPDGKTIVTSDEILQLKEMPKSLVVIGAGAVGIEFASMFARFGSTVTVIEMLPRILPLEDEEISAEAHKSLAKQMTIHVGAKTEAALKTDGGVEVGFHTAQGESKTLTAEMLLLAVGRGPVTDGLNLESTKAQLDRGYVRTNHLMQTDEPGAVRDRRRGRAAGPPAPAARPRRIRRGHRRHGAARRQAGRSRSTTTASLRPPTASPRRRASA